MFHNIDTWSSSKEKTFRDPLSIRRRLATLTFGEENILDVAKRLKRKITFFSDLRGRYGYNFYKAKFLL